MRKNPTRKSSAARASAAKPFLRMTPAERDADVARFEAGMSFDDTRPLSPEAKALWARAKRGRGRPRKPADQKASKVLISVEPTLLSRADAYARRRDMSRSELVAAALRQMMGGAKRSA